MKLPKLRSNDQLPKENVYTCHKRHHTVTVDVAEGVTPFMIECPIQGCNFPATSAMYPKSPRPEELPAPAYEWYRPEGKELDDLSRGELDHVERGGLLMRKRTNAKPVYHEL